MLTIRIDQSLSNCAMYEHRYLEKSRKLYIYAGKCNDQMQFEAIIEASMIFTPETFTDNITMSPGPPMIAKN